MSARALPRRVREAAVLTATLVSSRLLAPARPDRYLQMTKIVRRQGVSFTVGFALAAVRCPDRAGLIDERGTLTWRELDDRCNAFATALQSAPGGPPDSIGVMCRNHRGFVEAFVGASRAGSDVVLLNTSFAAPALAEVISRENITAVVYDDEFGETIGRALSDRPDAAKVVAWSEAPPAYDTSTLESVIHAHHGQRPTPPRRKGSLILLTSGTTGTPKGAKHSGGGPSELLAILTRVPWRARETTVVAAPMFHAWGFGQLVFSSIMACTVVTRRKFDPEATLAMVDRHRASGLSVVPVMFDRIMDLPPEIRKKYNTRSLRFANASGSRMRADVALAFMDEFGDVIYNNYNATEAGMVATATPPDLRAAPDTAGRPVWGTEIRILDGARNAVPTGTVGAIYVRNSSRFDGYTSGDGKDFHEGFIASGDLGYVDSSGRLFVTGRDDEMIVSGGENIYPIEVERALVTHPQVAEAVVLGVDDAEYGQRLAAFVVLARGATIGAAQLKDHVRGQLANYKVPRDLILASELPRNATGKIHRNELRSRLIGSGGQSGGTS
jgi:acyl-CoA synthetase (AMP-forming)/AMP-acid ligase II